MNLTLKNIALLAFLAGTGACNSNNGQEQGVQNKASASTASSVAMLPRSMAPQGAHLYFKEPKDGATVTSPVHIEFGLDGMDVVAAGTQAPMSGHHHVIIDSDLPPFDMPIPADDHHVHFGDGRIATDLELTPGNHSLQLLLGDHLHIPHQPPVYSERITITVE